MTDSYFPFDPFALLTETQQRFGLREEDARRATEALMPAFWAGLRHNASAPQGMDALMRAFTPPAFQPGGGGTPWSGAGVWPGAEWMSGQSIPGPVGAFLSQLFPNEAIRRAVLDQVAATTGLRHDALNAMMPVAATLMMGQMARNFAVGPARELLDAFMAGYARGRPRPAPSPADMMAPFADAMSAFFTGFARASEARPAPRVPDPEDEEEPEQTAETPEADDSNDAADTPPGGGEQARFLDDFMAAGRSMQESQIRAFEQLFETLVPAGSSQVR